MSRQRRRYDDKFRASAVVMLEAAGYPDKEGALTQTANHLGVPINTLKGWFTAYRNPPPTELRNEKKGELVDWIEAEVYAIFKEMPTARSGSSYRDLGTVAGILLDKLQNLKGQPNEILEIREGNPLDKLRSRLASIATAERERSGYSGTNGNGSGEASL